MTREELLVIIEEGAALATSLTGKFDYACFGRFMQLRAPEAWASEHFCSQCGRPGRFGQGVSIREGRTGEWR
jgi:hypothetical protein